MQARHTEIRIISQVDSGEEPNARPFGGHRVGLATVVLASPLPYRASN
jgi:hypothetical protein